MPVTPTRKIKALHKSELTVSGTVCYTL